MVAIKYICLTLAFVLELCALAALAYWGFETGRGWTTKAILGIGAPLLFAVVWGLLLAPKASLSVPVGVRLSIEFIAWALAAGALVAAGRPRLAATFMVILVLNRCVLFLIG